MRSEPNVLLFWIFRRMALSLRQSILEFFSGPSAPPVTLFELADHLELPRKQLGKLQGVVETLINVDEILKYSVSGKIYLPQKQMEGTIRRTMRNGWFRPLNATAEEDPYFVGLDDLEDACTGDTVLAQRKRGRGPGGLPVARVMDIIRRATTQFVGTYEVRNNRDVVLLDGGQFTEPVMVMDAKSRRLKPGDKVIVSVIAFPREDRWGEAVIERVLGARGKPGVDVETVRHEFQLAGPFPEDVLTQVHHLVAPDDDPARGERLDLTAETIITIDPADARDFDDAISLTRDADGEWRLGVHIADVAHYVRPGTPLDREACRRGTSTYFPGQVIPMLPEVLSNGLASLQAERLRYTQSVWITYNAEGVPVHAEFARTMIRAVRRFAYEEVIPFAESTEPLPTPADEAVRELLRRMRELAKLLRRRRTQHGALELMLPEVKIDLDDQGRVVGAHDQISDESHQLIEEFMLAANIQVAEALAKREIPFLRRVHPTPDERRLRVLAEFLTSLGLTCPKMPGRKDLQSLVDQVRGTSRENAVSYAILRSLKQAVYSPETLGHFALAEDHYCHFTSPIRRYPDLTIHRLFATHLAENRPGGSPVAKSRKKSTAHAGTEAGAPLAELVALGTQCSDAERRSEQAERELCKLKLLEYLAPRIGMELEATITGVERFGLFCRGISLPAEGLIHVASFARESFDYQERSHTLVGRRSGREFRLGDRLKVRVHEVDLNRRTLDFRFVQVIASAGESTSNTKPAPSRDSRKKPRAESPADVRRARKNAAEESPAPRKKTTSRAKTAKRARRRK